MHADTYGRRLGRVPHAHPALQLLVLHGSRAQSTAHAGSDWDLAYLADAELDHFQLLADLTAELGTDAVDLVDLAGASAVLRFRVARHGQLLFERRDGLFTEFVLQAALFWCDIEPVVRRAHAGVLAELG